MQYVSAHFFSGRFLPGLLLLTLLSAAVSAQSIPRAEADSLLRVLAESEADTNRVQVLLRLGAYQVYKPGEFAADMDSARTYVRQAQRLSRTLGDYAGEANSLDLLGTVSKESKDFPGAIAYQQAAIRLRQQHRDAKGEARSRMLLAQVWRAKGDTRQARTEAQTAIDLYTRNNHPTEVAEAYLELGNAYANRGAELEEKICYYHLALQSFTEAHLERRQADVLKDLGDLYQLRGNRAQAMLELRKSLALYQAAGYPAVQGVYDLLGYVSSQMGDYQQGLTYGLLAVRTAEGLKDSSLALCTIYNRIAFTYAHLQQFEKARVYFEKSLRVAFRYGDHASVMLLAPNLAEVLMQLNRAADVPGRLVDISRKYPPHDVYDSVAFAASFLKAYTGLKQYANAQKYCDQLISLAGRFHEDDVHRQYVFWAVIPFFLASKQYGRARTYLVEGEKHNLKTGTLNELATIQLWWFQLDSMQADYPSAIRHYQQYKRMQDALFNETKSKQIADLEVRYETEQKEKNLRIKEQEIKTLTREKQLQAQQMQQDELVRNVIFGGAVMVLLLLGMGYNRYRLKRRSNRQLQAQQREIRRQNEHLSQLLTEKDGLLGEKDALLSGQERLLAEKERLLKEIHHRVKNNLQVVMSLLNSQAASLQDKAALSAIQESQHRVQAMALIHQKLYQAEGVARIPMDSYIEEVVAYLGDSYCLDQLVRFCVEVEPIELDVTQAVPLGLIINEAITNAFKYAFPDGRPGTVRLSLHREGETTCRLTIADDGVGLPKGYDPAGSRSLGMTFLHGLSAQLGGQLVITSRRGVSISLVFAEEQLGPVYTPAAYAR